MCIQPITTYLCGHSRSHTPKYCAYRLQSSNREEYIKLHEVNEQVTKATSTCPQCILTQPDHQKIFPTQEAALRTHISSLEDDIERERETHQALKERYLLLKQAAKMTMEHLELVLGSCRYLEAKISGDSRSSERGEHVELQEAAFVELYREFRKFEIRDGDVKCVGGVRDRETGGCGICGEVKCLNERSDSNSNDVSKQLKGEAKQVKDTAASPRTASTAAVKAQPNTQSSPQPMTPSPTPPRSIMGNFTPNNENDPPTSLSEDNKINSSDNRPDRNHSLFQTPQQPGKPSRTNTTPDLADSALRHPNPLFRAQTTASNSPSQSRRSSKAENSASLSRKNSWVPQSNSESDRKGSLSKKVTRLFKKEKKEQESEEENSDMEHERLKRERRMKKERELEGKK